MADKLKVLFLCTGNSCRSQMAEGWAQHLKGDVLEPYSAGVETHGLNPLAVKVMAEAGVDISGQRSKHVEELKDIGFDYVVTVCDNAHEHCPLFPGRTKVIHVGFDDPPRLAAQAKTEKLAEFSRLENQIVLAHKALQRIIATRKDMCLDDVILDALKTPGANPRIERAIREQQCGVYNDGYCLVDSIEYHQEVASRQIRFFLDAARKEVEAPSANGLPSWREVSAVGTREFINRAGATPYESKAERTPPSQIIAEFLKAVE